MSTTERERCPTCDRPTDGGQHWRFEDKCYWREGAYCEYQEVAPIDWRKRCLAAEAQLAGVRPLVEALERIAGGLCPGGGTLIAGTMFAPCRKCAACQADAALAAYRALSRTEGRAGPQRPNDKQGE